MANTHTGKYGGSEAEPFPQLSNFANLPAKPGVLPY
jgi:hypothetical protein